METIKLLCHHFDLALKEEDQHKDSIEYPVKFKLKIEIPHPKVGDFESAIVIYI